MAGTVSTSYRTQIADRRRKQLVDCFAGLNVLPSTYAVPMRVMQLQRSGSSNMPDFAEAISADPSLAAKLLALSNSAAFSPAKPVTRISQAVSMIGLKNLLPLVFGLSVAGIFNKLGLSGSDRTPLWRAALLKAVAARELALRLIPDQAEEAFIAGLFQDVALPIYCASDPAAWPEMSAVIQLDDVADRRAREIQINGLDHAQLGRVLCTHLKLPALICQTVGAHHSGATAMAEHCPLPLAQALDLASGLPHRLPQLTQSVLQKLGTRAQFVGSNVAVVELVRATSKSYTETLARLGEADDSSAAFKQFLQNLGGEIARSVESAISESTTVIADLRAREHECLEQISELQKRVAQSEHDSLTRALTRGGFTARAKRLLAIAAEYQRPCALGFADLDNLKGLNDSLGHAGGDAALTMLSQRLADVTRGRGIIGRLGGDEFSILLVCDGGASAATETARINEALSGMQISVAGKLCAISASVGLTWLGVPPANSDLEALLQSADKLLYGAKGSGKAKCLADATN